VSADDSLLAAVEAFLYREARLLDEGEFEAWRQLFAEDGLYWIPGEPGQSDPATTVSILREDKAMLEMRVRRLGHPRAFALEPRPRTVHSLGNVMPRMQSGSATSPPRLPSTNIGPASGRFAPRAASTGYGGPMAISGS